MPALLTDPDVHGAELGFGLGGEGGDGFGAGEVGFDCEDSAAVTRGQRRGRGRVLADVGEHDVRAGLAEARGDRTADAAGASGDDGVAPGEREEVVDRTVAHVADGHGTPLERVAARSPGGVAAASSPGSIESAMKRADRSRYRHGTATFFAQ